MMAQTEDTCFFRSSMETSTSFSKMSASPSSSAVTQSFGRLFFPAEAAHQPTVNQHFEHILPMHRML